MISIVIVSKDELALDDTLCDVVRQADNLSEPAEVVVVDASDGRLDPIRVRHEAAVRWIDFTPPPGVRVSIPHQRNAGVRAARGDVIVFTDAGCQLDEGWLERLVAPVLNDEHVAAGLCLASLGRSGLYDQGMRQAMQARYLTESPTVNLAFRREPYEAVGGFDEGFAYGSDMDFSWRLVDAGYRIRSVPDAVVRHDFGGWRRQVRRSYAYGRARVRLYRKHRARWKRLLLDDPVVVIYPVFLLGLPLTLVFPLYPALLLVPAWRNRSNGPLRVVVNHLIYGTGILAELVLR
jgi:GT2 family glycosyltransferase